MFTEISWGSYITIVAVLITGYYLFVGFRYYQGDLLQLLSGKKMSPDNRASFTEIKKNRKENLQEAIEKPNLFQLAQSVSDEIQAFLHEGARNKLNGGEVMKGLHHLLGKYPDLKNSSFSEIIENLIINECEINFSMQLDTAQTKALWA